MSSTISSYGQNTVTTAAEPVVSGVAGCVSIILKAHPDNSGRLFIGRDSSVTSSNGFPLDAGEVLVWPCRDSDSCYVIASASDQKICYAVETL